MLADDHDDADAADLAEVPDFLSIGSLLKATPQQEGGRRFLYLEASNEGVDQQHEVVLAKALAEQADFYTRYGNLDLDHYTVVGAKIGIPDYPTYEIGYPVDVRQRDGVTFVKSELYQASAGRVTTPMVDKANMVWDSMTKLRPAQRWYPSVGGSVLHKSIEINPETGQRRALIDKVRWTNIGLSKTPANQHVQGCTVVPMDVFAKSLMAGGGMDWSLAKTLTAGYGTDSATLSGGAALREQSLDGSRSGSRDGMTYWHFREEIAGALRDGRVGANPDLNALTVFAVGDLGLPHGEAAEYVERFARDLKNGLSRRKAEK